MRISNLFFSLYLLAISACVPKVEGVQELPHGLGRELLRERCLTLSTVPHLATLIASVNSDTAELINLLSQGEAAAQSVRLGALRVRIQANLKATLSLVNSPMTELEFSQNISWELTDETLNELKSESDKWTVHSADVLGVYSWNSVSEELTDSSNQELVNLVNVSITPKQISINIHRPAHAIELCQLQNSLVGILKVTLLHRNGKTKSKLVQLNVKKLEDL